jgi:transcriptional regulator with XRE-family HTH domain
MPTTNVRALRHKLGLTQTEFWIPMGVTQSAGSRYETGRRAPTTVRTLIAITHGPIREARAIVMLLRKDPKLKLFKERP